MLREILLGNWKLVSWEVRGENGEVTQPFGPSPRGLLIYGDNDLMAAQLGDPDRANFAAYDRALGTLAELKAAFEGYTAYYGRYEIDEAAQTVTHYPDLALFPNYTGTTQVRHIRLEGNRLSLSSNQVSFQGQLQNYVLVWEKLN